MYSLYTAYDNRPNGFATSVLFWALVPIRVFAHTLQWERPMVLNKNLKMTLLTMNQNGFLFYSLRALIWYPDRSNPSSIGKVRIFYLPHP